MTFNLTLRLSEGGRGRERQGLGRVTRFVKYMEP